MRYLIITQDKKSFITKWFEYENHYQEGMIVIDGELGKISFDGVSWEDIEEDHL